MISRRTASFGVSYDYSQITYAEIALPSELQTICDAIDKELGFVPNNCLLNYYPDGNSAMGFHSDSSQELAEGSGVAIVSLGYARTIVYRHRLDKAIQFPYPLPNGSLLYMSNEVQQSWLHAIPREEGAGERISLTFRSIIKATLR